MPDQAISGAGPRSTPSENGPSGAMRTLRHGQGFDQGAVADLRGWRFAQPGVRVPDGLPHRVVALSPIMAAPGGSACRRFDGLSMLSRG